MDLHTLQIIVDVVLSIIAAVGGGVGIYFWKVNKSLKEAEVKEKEASVTEQQQQTWAHQNEEYQEYIRLLKDDNRELKESNKQKDADLEEMRTTLNDVVKRVGVLEVQVERAESFRCENLACIHRIPPLKKNRMQKIITSEKTEDDIEK